MAPGLNDLSYSLIKMPWDVMAKFIIIGLNNGFSPNYDKRKLGRVTPLGQPSSVYKSDVECGFLEFWDVMAKRPWRSSSMTLVCNTIQDAYLVQIWWY